ncbi:hypothetical protein D3C85_1549960 [compost metagenome]
MQVWIKNRLFPRGSAVRRHDRRDYVNKLCHAGHSHPIGVAQQRNQHAAYEQRILEGVDILQLRRCDGPRVQPFIRIIGVEPYIPFIKA